MSSLPALRAYRPYRPYWPSSWPALSEWYCTELRSKLTSSNPVSRVAMGCSFRRCDQQRGRCSQLIVGTRVSPVHHGECWRAGMCDFGACPVIAPSPIRNCRSTRPEHIRVTRARSRPVAAAVRRMRKEWVLRGIEQQLSRADVGERWVCVLILRAAGCCGRATTRSQQEEVAEHRVCPPGCHPT